MLYRMQVNEGMWVVNKANEINVNGVIVRSVRIGRDDYISLTDIASLKNSTAPKDVVKNCSFPGTLGDD